MHALAKNNMQIYVVLNCLTFYVYGFPLDNLMAKFHIFLMFFFSCEIFL